MQKKRFLNSKIQEQKIKDKNFYGFFFTRNFTQLK